MWIYGVTWEPDMLLHAGCSAPKLATDSGELFGNEVLKRIPMVGMEDLLNVVELPVKYGLWI